VPTPTTWERLSEVQICLGTMYFGSTVSEDRSREILDRFVERGGSLIDTANCYSFWVDGGTGEESERVIGRWLADRGARDDVLLATKVGARPEPLGASWPEHAEGLTSKVIREQFERSTERLGCDRLDVYLAHLDDQATDLAETLGTFAELVGEGLVGVLGASNLTTERLRAARELSARHDWPAYQVVQQRYTYLAPLPHADIAPQQVIDDEMTAYASTQTDLALYGYSPLLSGAYTRPDRSLAPEYQGPDTPRRLETLRTVSGKLGVTPNQLVLAWMLASTPRVVPVLGVSDVAQLDEAMDALSLELDKDVVEELTAAR
jgi:aryl-alcohol dehydrogenase-like predicted oxidoreductase